MAISIDVTPAHAMTPDEFADRMRGVEFRGPQDLVELAEPFAMLNANKRLLVDHLNQLLREWREPNRKNNYTGQTFILFGGSNYFVRANVWLPPSYPKLPEAATGNQFFYGIAHDHNFSFMTAGHHGAGYRTRIFEHDGVSKVLAVGDRVDSRFLEDTDLSLGKLMVFRASRDIHIQYAPQAFSVSLNLMVANREETRRTQYLFDEKCERVTGYGRGASPEFEYFFMAAAAIGDGETRGLLGEVAECHPEKDVGRLARTALEYVV